MIALARRIIETKEGHFDATQFVDSYDEALRAMIAQKQRGRKPAATKEVATDRGNVIDLMAALMASVAKHKAKRAPAAKAAPAPKTKARARR